MKPKVLTATCLAGACAGLVLAASGALTKPAACLLHWLPNRLSFSLLGGGKLLPLHARILGIYLALALVAICALCVWRQYLCNRSAGHFFTTKRGKYIFVILIILTLLTVSVSVNRIFRDDEIEHIHASWYVHHGHMPYRDFFEHHHPLFWFLLSPLLAIAGEGVMALAIIRLLMLCMAVGIAYLTWRIAWHVSGNAAAAWLAVAILFANYMFMACVIEVRPDVPMTLLTLAALERLLLFMKTNRPSALFMAAALASLALLCQQKAVFLVAAMSLWIIWQTLARHIKPAHFAVTAGIFCVPLLAFTIWLVATGSWHDYMLCNWQLNMRRTAHPAFWLDIGIVSLINAAFWIAAAPALYQAWRSNAHAVQMKTLAFFTLISLAAIALYPYPGDRHFLLPLPLLSALVSVFLLSGNGWWRRGKWHAVLMTGLLVIPLPFLAGLTFPLNGVQLEKFAFVLQRTQRADCVLDGANEFNLFRQDLHYFWFNVSIGVLDDYRRCSGSRHISYDVCQLVHSKKPRFMLLSQHEWKSCELWHDYLPTAYRNLFMRETGAKRR